MEMTMAKPPPARASRAKTPPKASPVTAAREEVLTGLGQIAQIPLLATRQYADAAAIGMHWPGTARELAKLAEAQPGVAKLIDPLMKAGPYAALTAAVLPLVMQLAVNHGALKPGIGGTAPPGALAAEMERHLAEQETELLRQQRAAEAEVRAQREALEAERTEETTAE